MPTISTTVYTGPGKRIGAALLGVLLGPLFIIGSAAALFYNGSHALHMANSLTAGAAAVVEAAPEPADTSHEGQLVHVTGDAQPEGTVSDPEFGVTAPGVKLARTVEIYEWERSGRKQGNYTTYEYKTEWKNYLINSGNFYTSAGHENPASVAYPDKEFLAESVSVGAFQLDPDLVKKIGGASPLALRADDVTLPDGAQLQPGGVIYIGRDPAVPAVGDLRLTENLPPAGTVSIVAAQQGSKLAPYESKNGQPIALLEPGRVDAAQMFRHAQSANTVLSWIFRGASFVGLLIGILSIFGPVSFLASYVPFLGALVEGGVFLISFLLAVVDWLVLVGVAWITARPLVAIPLLIVAVLAIIGLAFLLLKRHKTRKLRLAGMAAMSSAVPSMPQPSSSILP